MSSLQDAQDALQRGDLEQVQVITADLLKGDPDNAGAWYLLSKAVTGERQELFLHKALVLDPDIEAQFISEPEGADLADELFDFSPSTFPELSGPPEDDVDFFNDSDMILESIDEDDAEDDFYAEPSTADVVDNDFASSSDSSNAETIAEKVTDDQEKGAESSFTFDTNLIMLAVLGILIVVVAVLFAQSLFS